MQRQLQPESGRADSCLYYVPAFRHPFRKSRVGPGHSGPTACHAVDARRLEPDRAHVRHRVLPVGHLNAAGWSISSTFPQWGSAPVCEFPSDSLAVMLRRVGDGRDRARSLPLSSFNHKRASHEGVDLAKESVGAGRRGSNNGPCRVGHDRTTGEGGPVAGHR